MPSNDNRFLGAPYPIKKHPLGLLHTESGTKQIKSDLLLLLMTNPGERVMLPEFGTPFRTLLFEPNDDTTAATARQMIIDSINRWEPRIVVNKIEVSNFYDDGPLWAGQTAGNHVLHIKIEFFDPENIKEVDALVLDLPLTGN